MGWVTMAVPSRNMPKPKPADTVSRTTETSRNSGSGNIPQAAVGMPVAAVLGQKRVPDANTIWTGNLRPLTQTVTSSVSSQEEDNPGGSGFVTTTTTTTTTSTTTTAIVGYLVDIHMGICLGPDVHLLAIYVDNQPIWSGDVGPARTQFSISENDTFLSKATCIFSGGAYDQAPEPLVDVPDYPGYVGVATILLKDVRVDLPMGNLSFEVYRKPNPLGLAAAVNASGNDINVATAITEVITNPWGYGGLDISNLDTVKLSSIAATLASEINFCSLKIGSDVSVAAVLKSFQEQADMVLFQHPKTGLITGALNRLSNVGSATSATSFNPRNIISVSNLEKSWWQDTVDQARGLYTERDSSYNEVPVFVQNAANMSLSGRGRKTFSVYYPYVPNKQLTLALVSRDLAKVAAPVIALSLHVNRDGASKLPGDIVYVTHPDYGLLNMPMLVLKVRKQPINQNSVTLELVQAKFPDTTPLFGSGGAGADPGFDLRPKKPTGMSIINAPYFFARLGFGIASTQVSPRSYPVLLPRPANNMQFSFSALITNVPGAAGDSEMVGTGLYPTYGQLDAAITRFDGFNDGLIASLKLKNVINPTNLARNIGEAGVRSGQLFIIVDNEIMSFQGVTNNGDGTYTLTNVRRGLLDTVAEDHSMNANVYVVNNNLNYVSSGLPFPLGYTPNWVVTSNTLNLYGKKDDGLVYSGWTPANARILCPPAPHDTRVAGVRSQTPVPVVEGNSLTVTWKTRSRLNLNVRLQTDAADAPEGGQTHRVFHRSGGGSLTELGSGPYTGNTATFTMPNVTNGIGSIFVQSEITLAGVPYTSIYRDLVPVDVS